MEFIDLSLQQKRIEDKLAACIGAVLAHGRYIMGPEVTQLENALARFTGTKHAIGCASGTDALLLALMAHGIGPGDGVITTPFTFIATAEVISLLGATPIFVDIEPNTFNISPHGIENAVEAIRKEDTLLYPLPRTVNRTVPSVKGIIGVDLFGLPADYDRIDEIAKKHGLFVVEDAAQSLGAEYKGRKACSLGGVGCTSFFPAKPLGCYGDGGMCFCDDDGLVETIRSLRVHGKGKDKYDNTRIGINGRLDTLQAAILLAKLTLFPEEIVLRQNVSRAYGELLADFGERVIRPVAPEGYLSVWAQYSVLTEDSSLRSLLQKKLREESIPTAVYYPRPLHLQPAFSYLGYEKGDFPVSEDVASRIFSLPMHPYLKVDAQKKVADIIRGVLEGGGN